MSPPKAQAAILFDIDGTLIDSNYLHIQAWSEAFAAIGRPVDAWRIHRAIGMDSDKLLAELLGDDREAVEHSVNDVHSRIYQGLTARLRCFDGARELIRQLSERGVAVALVTSAPGDELAALRNTLAVEPWLSAVTSAEDADTAKPEPDLVHVALEKLGVRAERAVFIGDTVWDGQACSRAGVRFVGVRSGGIAAAELRSAGAVEVYDGPADVRNHLGSPVFDLLG